MVITIDLIAVPIIVVIVIKVTVIVAAIMGIAEAVLIIAHSATMEIDLTPIRVESITTVIEAGIHTVANVMVTEVIVIAPLDTIIKRLDLMIH